MEPAQFIAIAAAAAGAAAMTPAPVPVPGTLKTFGDWTVGCDNGRACQASALLPEDSYEGLTMAIERDAAADAAPRFRLSIADVTKPPIALAIDGTLYRASFALRSDTVRVMPADAAVFIKALRNGQRLELFAVGGVSVGSVSLNGASAALLYVDDRQYRVGTVTALVRSGAKAASAVPPPPPLPVIKMPARSAAPPRPAPLSEQKARIAKLECAISDDQNFKPDHFRLDAANSLTLLPYPCGNGAYNYYSEALIVSETGKVSAARFDVSASMGGSDDGNDNVIVNASYSDETRTLSTYAKGRGLGDCGVVNTYAWDGSQFRLSQQEVMDECRGSVDYITVWRAQTIGN